MSKMIDLTGTRYKNLTVLKRVMPNTAKTKSGYSETRWLCKCDCGNEIIVRGHGILYEKARGNCGCKPEVRKKIKHGMSHTKLHQKWLSMKDRCYCENDVEYKNYGGRGIKVCDEWLGENGAESFIKWALENGYQDGLSIDRIDVNGNYEPGNCRFADSYIQANNKRNTLWVNYNNEKLSLKQACDKSGINYMTAYGRLKSGMAADEIFLEKDFRSLNSGHRKKSDDA